MSIIISRIKLAVLIIIILISIGGSCHKDGTSCLSNHTSYNFDAVANIYPGQEIYHVGDTIFFTSQIATTLIDKLSGQTIDYSNAISLSGNNGIHFIDTILKQLIPARDSFTLVSIVGSFIEELGTVRGGINTGYIQNGNFYRFLGGFICKKRGIYSFGIGDLLSPGLSGKNCTKATFNMMLNNTDKHIPLYQYALGVIPDADGMKRIYCFRVQ